MCRREDAQWYGWDCLTFSLHLYKPFSCFFALSLILLKIWWLSRIKTVCICHSIMICLSSLTFSPKRLDTWVWGWTHLSFSSSVYKEWINPPISMVPWHKDGNLVGTLEWEYLLPCLSSPIRYIIIYTLVHSIW